MAYPTNSLSLVIQDVDRRAVDMKGYAQRIKDRLASGDTPATVVIDLFIRLKNDRIALLSAASAPGLGPYAQMQKADDTLDIAAEFNAMLSAIDGVTDWIGTNFPKDENGFLLRETWGEHGPVDRQFSASVTEGLRVKIDYLLATIE